MDTEFSSLLGLTLVNVENRANEEMIFTTSEGRRFLMCHDQDCCESVRIEDVVGDLTDLIGSPLTMAEAIQNPNNVNPAGVPEKEFQDSFTWTFYKLATIKGYVTIRWYGESNGYYSESVSFTELNKD